ncbi:MAG TPA: hypothetical protein EYQ25_11495 [Planctomycetes bacterium]|nr:hypothetical protein [Planctomycetota bacterium]HIL37930.1 hypothetical protein [Planctomycetota bacterium]
MRVLDELEARIRKRGVRVEERLELLNRLRKSDPSQGHGQEQLNQRLAEFKTAIQGAARAIQKEIR